MSPGFVVSGPADTGTTKEKEKMSLKLIATYSKHLGLPGYSSHQYAVSLEAEITNINDAAAESSRLYQMLQTSVDSEIQNTGFVPPSGYGLNGKSQGSGNGSASVNGQNGSNGNGNGYSANGNGSNGSNGSNGNGHNGDAWNCSDKQRELITKLVGEHHLDKGEVDATSHDMFGVGVKELNKLQASGLIERILDEHGGGRKVNGARSRSTPPRRQYANGGV